MTDAQLRRMPKVELHRHLDGSVRLETILDLARSHGIRLPADNPEELRKLATITAPLRDLREVLDGFAILQSVCASYDALKRIAYENVEDAVRDGVQLIELRFAPAFIAAGKDLGNDEIIEGVVDGVRAALADFPVEVGLIGIVARSQSLEANTAATADLIRYSRSDHPEAWRIRGFDLADNEAGFDARDFVPLVQQARDAGLGITIHSGEDTDAAAVSTTLELFGAERIGHGVRIWGDEEVMQQVRDAGALLEVSPTSNWLTRAVPSRADHPLVKLHRAGVPVCLNSDDPHLFGIDLVTEYRYAVDELGASLEELQLMNQRALSASFLPEDCRSRARRLMEQAAS